MASISDDELRIRLSKFDVKDVPPVTGSTRALLASKLDMLESSVDCRKDAVPQHDVETIVFFDLETTGIQRTTFKPKITELSLVAVSCEDFLQFQKKLDSKVQSGKACEIEFSRPRVLNKLTLCVNPGTLIMPMITDITGLDNYNLEHQSTFNRDTARLVEAFLTRLPEPVCLVAHNGNHFDFPLLNAELYSVDADKPTLRTLCVDSLLALRDIFKRKREPSEDHSLRTESRTKRPRVDTPCAAQVSPPSPPHDPSLESPKPPLADGESIAEQPFTPTTLDKPQRKDPPTLCTKFDKMKEENGNECDIKPLSNRARKRLDFSPESETFSQQPKSFSLPVLHEHIFGVKPRVSHGAEEDCLALMRVCAHKAQDFIQYVKTNSCRLESLPRMWQC